MLRGSTWLALVVALLAGVWAVDLLHDRALPVADALYRETYPNLVYAARCARDAGRGLLWNPYQSSGRPFLADLDVGLLFPPNLFFLFLDGPRALDALLVLQLVIAGLGMYGLCRSLGAGVAPALAGALAFEVGGGMPALSLDAPRVASAWVWLPAVMLCGERLLRKPSATRVAALALVLALQLLGGAPAASALSYALLLLRIDWVVVTRPSVRSRRTVIAVAAALLLPLGLAAVQLLPALSFTRTTVAFGVAVPPRPAAMALTLVSALLAGAGLVCRAVSKHAAFYATVGVLGALLALADPARMGPWGAPLVAFSVAVLTGLGVHAMAHLPGRRPWAIAAGMTAAVLVGLAGAHALSLAPPTPLSGALAAIVILAPLASATSRAGRRLIAPVLLAAVATNLVARPRLTHGLLSSDRPLFAQSAALASLRGRVTSQDRFVFPTRSEALGLGAMPKTASLLRLRGIDDETARSTRTYATLLARLHRPAMPLHLLDLVGGRWLVTDDPAGTTAALTRPPRRPPRVAVNAGPMTVIENPNALPRALWVPAAEVVADPERLLERLETPTESRRQLVLLDAAPPSGFLGNPNEQRPGTANFVVNRERRVAVRVVAPARGFLVLGDQWDFNWRAKVNRTPTPILRANLAFRAVEVPAGSSTIEFRYVPRSLPLGMAVSILTAAALVLAVRRERRARGDENDGGSATP